MKRAPAKPSQITPEQIQQIEQAVFTAVEPLLDNRFYLLNVSYEKEAGYWYLRVYIEGREAPLSLNDCEQISRQLDFLDEMKILEDLTYNLEVSSPGVFRPLKTQREFDFYQGRPVRVETIEPKKKNKKAPKKVTTIWPEGILESVNIAENKVTLKNPSNKETFDLVLNAEQVVYLNPILQMPEDESTTEL